MAKFQQDFSALKANLQGLHIFVCQDCGARVPVPMLKIPSNHPALVAHSRTHEKKSAPVIEPSLPPLNAMTEPAPDQGSKIVE